MSIVKKERQWNFSASAATASVTPLLPVTLRTPTVLYTPEVWAVIQLAVAECSKEVGWLGTVQVLESGDYLIDQVFIPEQFVTGAETDIDAQTMAALAQEIIAAGDDPGRLMYWGHSHVNMGVSPSGQDETQIEAYLADQPVMIRGIYNKKGDAKVDVFDRNQGVVFQCVPHRTAGLSPEREAAWKAVIAANVKERVYPTATWPTYSQRTPTQQQDGKGTTTGKKEDAADIGGGDELARYLSRVQYKQVADVAGNKVFMRDVVDYDFDSGCYIFPQDSYVMEDLLTQDEEDMLNGIIYCRAQQQYATRYDDFGMYAGFDDF